MATSDPPENYIECKRSKSRSNESTEDNWPPEETLDDNIHTVVYDMQNTDQSSLDDWLKRYAPTNTIQ